MYSLQLLFILLVDVSLWQEAACESEVAVLRDLLLELVVFFENGLSQLVYLRVEIYLVLCFQLSDNAEVLTLVLDLDELLLLDSLFVLLHQLVYSVRL